MSDFAYIGREPECGCVTCATVDNPDHAKATAADIAQWVRWGMTVERVPVAEARAALNTCPHWRIFGRNDSRRARTDVPIASEAVTS